MKNTKRLLKNIKIIMNVLIILKLRILIMMRVLYRQPKNKKSLIKRLMTMKFKHHVIQYVIDIVTLCGGEMKELGKYINKSQQNIKGKYPLIFH